MSTRPRVTAAALLAAAGVVIPTPAYAEEMAEDGASVLFARAQMETYGTASPYALKVCAEGDSAVPGTWTLRLDGATTAPVVIAASRTVVGTNMPPTTCAVIDGKGGTGSAAGTITFTAGPTPVALCHMAVEFLPAAEDAAWVCVESYPLTP
jgi:hypothetical protein